MVVAASCCGDVFREASQIEMNRAKYKGFLDENLL
jgi:hypothetical protein